MWRQNNENSKHLTAEYKMILMSENIIHTNKELVAFLNEQACCFDPPWS